MTTSNLHRNMYLVELPSSQSCRPTLQLLLVRIADHRHCTMTLIAHTYLDSVTLATKLHA